MLFFLYFYFRNFILFTPSCSSRKLCAPFAGPVVAKTILCNDRYKVAALNGDRRYERVVAADRMRKWCQLESLSDEDDSEVLD